MITKLATGSGSTPSPRTREGAIWMKTIRRIAFFGVAFSGWLLNVPIDALAHTADRFLALLFRASWVPLRRGKTRAVESPPGRWRTLMAYLQSIKNRFMERMSSKHENPVVAE
jgi:hypothetical protein